MTPFWHDEHLTLYGGDCRDVLRELPVDAVHCVVTSPPYWGLRDYGTDGQLGLESTPEAYVSNMVAVFREVRRVLRADGTLWLNLGDSYATSNPVGRRDADRPFGRDEEQDGSFTLNVRRETGLKPKDLVGIPWRVAFALQADGWYLRSDIIWSKPNPMPESVTDRPTKAHEYLFLLSKSARYYWDADAVREPHTTPDGMGWAANGKGTRYSTSDYGDHLGAADFSRRDGLQAMGGHPNGRNLRSVWTIATEPYPGAHFATFPRKLVEPCVKAGTSERGVCPECGAPWVRVVERRPNPAGITGGRHREVARPEGLADRSGRDYEAERAAGSSITTGWSPSCGCRRSSVLSAQSGHSPSYPSPNSEYVTPQVRQVGSSYASIDEAYAPVPAVVLDPFAGSGTTLFVAQALGRRGIGIDLNPEYLRQALERNAQTPLGLVG